MEKGHLLGSKLGGPGGGCRNGNQNMVPLTRVTNSPVMYAYENRVLIAVRKGECVTYTVIPHYARDKYYPDYLTISAVGLTPQGAPIPGGVHFSENNTPMVVGPPIGA